MEVTGECAGCKKIKTITVPDNYIPSLVTKDGLPLIACDECLQKEKEEETKSLKKSKKISTKEPSEWDTFI